MKASFLPPSVTEKPSSAPGICRQFAPASADSSQENSGSDPASPPDTAAVSTTAVPIPFFTVAGRETFSSPAVSPVSLETSFPGFSSRFSSFPASAGSSAGFSGRNMTSGSIREPAARVCGSASSCSSSRPVSCSVSGMASASRIYPESRSSPASLASAVSNEIFSQAFRGSSLSVARTAQATPPSGKVPLTVCVFVPAYTFVCFLTSTYPLSKTAGSPAEASSAPETDSGSSG